MGWTFLFVHTEDDDDFVPAYTDEFLDRSNTSTREFREEDHSLNVIVFQLDINMTQEKVDSSDPIEHFLEAYTKTNSSKTHQFHISTHLGNLTNLNHDQFVHLWISLFVITHFVRFEVLSIGLRCL